MSLVKIQGNASGTGIFTVAAPNSNTDRTLTLPDSTGTLATAESTLSQFNASGSAPVYACRAWVNFNGVSTVSITASGNVSSITDNGVGDYTVNFANALVDANYNFVTNSSNTTSANILCIAQLNWDNPTKSTSALRFYNLKTNTGALTDQNTISVSIFR